MLPGLGQEHQPTTGDVCVINLEGGAQANHSRVSGMSAPKTWARAQEGGVGEEFIASITIVE